MKQLADALTQTATVSACAQGWSGGAETLGTATDIYSRIPCLVQPLSPVEALQQGLNITHRPALILFESGKYITEDSTGQPYQVVKITVGDNVYYATGPQVEFGANLGCDDLKVVQVPCSQRQAAIT